MSGEYVRKGIGFGITIAKWTLIILGIIALIAFAGIYMFMNSDQGKAITGSISENPEIISGLISKAGGGDAGANSRQSSQQTGEETNIQDLKNEETSNVGGNTGVRYEAGKMPSSLKVSNFGELYILDLRKVSNDIYFVIRNWNGERVSISAINVVLSVKLAKDPEWKDYSIKMAGEGEALNIGGSQHFVFKRNMLESRELSGKNIEDWEIVKIDFA